MRRFPSLQTLRAELTLCATNRHSPHFRMAVSAAVRSTSAFRWKGDLQICAILVGNRRPKIGRDDSGYSRFSPKADLHGASFRHAAAIYGRRAFFVRREWFGAAGRLQHNERMVSRHVLILIKDKVLLRV